MIHSAPEFDSALDGRPYIATPIAAIMLTATFVVAALGGAALAGLQLLIST